MIGMNGILEIPLELYKVIRNLSVISMGDLQLKEMPDFS